jgi:hypothetical protein
MGKQYVLKAERYGALNRLVVTFQNQANLIKICVECLHSKVYTLSNLFGGYAISRKHAVFSRLALNSYD